MTMVAQGLTGAALKTLLGAHGQTQQAFADHMGRSLRQVQRWCASERAVPRYVVLSLGTLIKDWNGG